MKKTRIGKETQTQRTFFFPKQDERPKPKIDNRSFEFANPKIPSRKTFENDLKKFAVGDTSNEYAQKAYSALIESYNQRKSVLSDLSFVLLNELDAKKQDMILIQNCITSIESNLFLEKKTATEELETTAQFYFKSQMMIAFKKKIEMLIEKKYGKKVFEKVKLLSEDKKNGLDKFPEELVAVVRNFIDSSLEVSSSKDKYDFILKVFKDTPFEKKDQFVSVSQVFEAFYPKAKEIFNERAKIFKVTDLRKAWEQISPIFEISRLILEERSMNDEQKTKFGAKIGDFFRTEFIFQAIVLCAIFFMFLYDPQPREPDYDTIIGHDKTERPLFGPLKGFYTSANDFLYTPKGSPVNLANIYTERIEKIGGSPLVLESKNGTKEINKKVLDSIPKSVSNMHQYRIYQSDLALKELYLSSLTGEARKKKIAEISNALLDAEVNHAFVKFGLPHFTKKYIDLMDLYNSERIFILDKFDTERKENEWSLWTSNSGNEMRAIVPQKIDMSEPKPTYIVLNNTYVSTYGFTEMQTSSSDNILQIYRESLEKGLSPKLALDGIIRYGIQHVKNILSKSELGSRELDIAQEFSQLLIESFVEAGKKNELISEKFASIKSSYSILELTSEVLDTNDIYFILEGIQSELDQRDDALETFMGYRFRENIKDIISTVSVTSSPDFVYTDRIAYEANFKVASDVVHSKNIRDSRKRNPGLMVDDFVTKIVNKIDPEASFYVKSIFSALSGNWMNSVSMWSIESLLVEFQWTSTNIVEPIKEFYQGDEEDKSMAILKLGGQSLLESVKKVMNLNIWESSKWLSNLSMTATVFSVISAIASSFIFLTKYAKSIFYGDEFDIKNEIKSRLKNYERDEKSKYPWLKTKGLSNLHSYLSSAVKVAFDGSIRLQEFSYLILSKILKAKLAFESIMFVGVFSVEVAAYLLVPSLTNIIGTTFGVLPPFIQIDAQTIGTLVLALGSSCFSGCVSLVPMLYSLTIANVDREEEEIEAIWEILKSDTSWNQNYLTTRTETMIQMEMRRKNTDETLTKRALSLIDRFTLKKSISNQLSMIFKYFDFSDKINTEPSVEKITSDAFHYLPVLSKQKKLRNYVSTRVGNNSMSFLLAILSAGIIYTGGSSLKTDIWLESRLVKKSVNENFGSDTFNIKYYFSDSPFTVLNVAESLMNQGLVFDNQFIDYYTKNTYRSHISQFNLSLKSTDLSNVSQKYSPEFLIKAEENIRSVMDFLSQDSIKKDRIYEGEYPKKKTMPEFKDLGIDKKVDAIDMGTNFILEFIETEPQGWIVKSSKTDEVRSGLISKYYPEIGMVIDKDSNAFLIEILSKSRLESLENAIRFNKSA